MDIMIVMENWWRSYYSDNAEPSAVSIAVAIGEPESRLCEGNASQGLSTLGSVQAMTILREVCSP